MEKKPMRSDSKKERITHSVCVGGPMTLYHDVCGAQTETVIPILQNVGKGGLFDRKIRSFLDAVKTNGPAPVPTSQILYNQAIIYGINRSAACGHAAQAFQWGRFRSENGSVPRCGGQTLHAECDGRWSSEGCLPGTFCEGYQPLRFWPVPYWRPARRVR